MSGFAILARKIKTKQKLFKIQIPLDRLGAMSRSSARLEMPCSHSNTQHAYSFITQLRKVHFYFLWLCSGTCGLYRTQ